MRKPKNDTVPALLAALLIGAALSGAPAGAAGYGEQQGAAGLKQDFRTLDKNGDGYLSLEEFKQTGKDELAFKGGGPGRRQPPQF